MNKDIETKTHTALHVLKGAAQKVLGLKWTAGVYVKGDHGRLTVQFDRKPEDNEIERIQSIANDKIRKDVPIEIYNLERGKAEERWGDSIYDLFPIPDSIKTLTIFHLPGWNVNACNHEHTKTTGEIGRIVISKTRFRKSKNLLEITYDIVE